MTPTEIAGWREAGRAVAAHALGIRVRRMSLRPAETAFEHADGSLSVLDLCGQFAGAFVQCRGGTFRGRGADIALGQLIALVHWGAIEHLARRLLACGSLDEQVIAAVLTGAPERVSPLAHVELLQSLAELASASPLSGRVADAVARAVKFLFDANGLHV